MGRPISVIDLTARRKPVRPSATVLLLHENPSALHARASKNGHRLVDIAPAGPGYVATLRKGGAALATAVSALGKNETSMVVFSGDLDKLIAAFIIANGALSMGEEELSGITETDLIEGVEFGGVATLLGEANESGTTFT